MSTNNKANHCPHPVINCNIFTDPIHLLPCAQNLVHLIPKSIVHDIQTQSKFPHKVQGAGHITTTELIAQMACLAFIVLCTNKCMLFTLTKVQLLRYLESLPTPSFIAKFEFVEGFPESIKRSLTISQATKTMQIALCHSLLVHKAVQKPCLSVPLLARTGLAC